MFSQITLCFEHYWTMPHSWRSSYTWLVNSWGPRSWCAKFGTLLYHLLSMWSWANYLPPCILVSFSVKSRKSIYLSSIFLSINWGNYHITKENTDTQHNSLPQRLTALWEDTHAKTITRWYDNCWKRGLYKVQLEHGKECLSLNRIHKPMTSSFTFLTLTSPLLQAYTIIYLIFPL